MVQSVCHVRVGLPPDLLLREPHEHAFVYFEELHALQRVSMLSRRSLPTALAATVAAAAATATSSAAFPERLRALPGKVRVFKQHRPPQQPLRR